MTRYSSVVVAHHPSAYWPMGDRGPIVADVVQAHHGSPVLTRVGLSSLQDKHSPATLFSGATTAGVNVPQHSDFDPTKNFTAELWVRTPPTLPAATQGLLSNCDLSTTNKGFVVMMQSNKSILLQLGNGTAGSWATPAASILPNTMYHIVCVYTFAGTGSAVIYFNTVSQSLTTGSPPPAGAATTKVLQIGNAFTTGNAANGWTIQHVAYYPRALTAAEVSLHWISSSGGNGPLLLKTRRGRILISREKVAIALVGQADGVATVTGAVQKAVLLTGSAAGIATVTGTIKAATRFTGTSAGVATVTGSFQPVFTLHGSSTGVGTASGFLAVPPPVALLFTPKTPGTLTLSAKSVGTLSLSAKTPGVLSLSSVTPGTGIMLSTPSVLTSLYPLATLYPSTTLYPGASGGSNTITFIPIQNLE